MFYGYGILNNHVPTLRATVMKGVSISWDTDALAFITAASITDTTQKNAVNQLVLDLKTASIWTKMKAIYPFVGGTASSHKFNLKDPRDLDIAYRLVFSGGWTHSATGALPNGTTGYADSKLTPSLNFSSSNSVGVSNYQTDQGNGAGEGSYSSGARFLYGATTSFIDIRINTDASTPNSIAYSSNGKGLFTVGKNGTANVENYRNGVFIASTAKITAPVDKALYIGARNANGTADGFNAVEKRFESYHDGLNSTDITNLYTSVQAYQTTLGRQI